MCVCVHTEEVGQDDLTSNCKYKSTALFHALVHSS